MWFLSACCQIPKYLSTILQFVMPPKNFLKDTFPTRVMFQDRALSGSQRHSQLTQTQQRHADHLSEYRLILFIALEREEVISFTEQETTHHPESKSVVLKLCHCAACLIPGIKALVMSFPVCKYLVLAKFIIVSTCHLLFFFFMSSAFYHLCQ